MYSKFLNLKTEKQERILNSAMKEFAEKGYENASTNEIVKNADISKGILFHYFGNKKKLYLFLYDYCIEIMQNDFYKNIDLNESDIFNKLHQIMRIKLELINKYPQIFKYLEVATKESQSDVKSTIELKTDKLLQSAYGKIFDNIDTSKFKEDINATSAINIIMYTLEGFFANEIKKMQSISTDKYDYENAFAQAEIYIDILKNVFYKKGGT